MQNENTGIIAFRFAVNDVADMEKNDAIGARQSNFLACRFGLLQGIEQYSALLGVLLDGQQMLRPLNGFLQVFFIYRFE